MNDLLNNFVNIFTHLANGVLNALKDLISNIGAVFTSSK